MDSIRNSLLGRSHYPHQHFMETGAHSITMLAHTSQQDATMPKYERTKDMIWLLEKLLRIHD